MKIPSIPQSCLDAPSKCPHLRGGTPSWLREASVHRARKQPLPSQAAVWKGTGAPWPGLPPLLAAAHRSASHMVEPRPRHPALLFSHLLCPQGLRCPGERRRAVGPVLRAFPSLPHSFTVCQGPLRSWLSQSPGDVSRTSLGRSRLARDLITIRGTELLCRVELRTNRERSSGAVL